jgi:hypothetical protein
MRQGGFGIHEAAGFALARLARARRSQPAAGAPGQGPPSAMYRRRASALPGLLSSYGDVNRPTSAISGGPKSEPGSRKRRRRATPVDRDATCSGGRHCGTARKAPPMAGFRAFAGSVQLPILRFWPVNSPKVSGPIRQYSHFGETLAGDLVRSRLPPGWQWIGFISMVRIPLCCRRNSGHRI